MFNRLLPTGAAGGLGRELRARLKAHCAVPRLSDIAPHAAASPHHFVFSADARFDVLALRDLAGRRLPEPERGRGRAVNICSCQYNEVEYVT